MISSDLGLIGKVMSKAPSPVFWVSRSGRILYANQMAMNLTGYSQVALLNRCIMDINIDLDKSGWQAFWHCLEDAEFLTLDGTFLNRVGMRLPVRQDASLVDYTDDEQCVLLMVRDAQQRRDAEHKLDQNRALLGLLFEATMESIFDWSFPEGLLGWEELHHWLIYDVEEGADNANCWLNRVHPDDEADVLNKLRMHLLGKDSRFECECRLRLSDGWVWSLLRGKVVVHYSCGSPCRMVGTCVDISKRKANDAELERYRHHLEELVQQRTKSLTRTNEALLKEIRRSNRAEQELSDAKQVLEGTNERLEIAIARAEEHATEVERANRAKNEFLATVSHEIRTPLNGMIGMLELLSESELGRDQKAWVDAIGTESETLLTIISDILDYTRIEAGTMELDPEDFDLEQEMQNILNSLSASALNKGLELKFEINKSARVFCDRVRLRQVLVNLLNNAIKFTEEGSVSLCVEIRPKDDVHLWGKFMVSDTGPGIPEESRESVFHSFKQIDGGLSRIHGGIGLGLAICRKIVGRLNGQIWLDSVEGLGSNFYVSLPLTVSKASDEASKIDDASRVVSTNLEGSILVVEDYPVNQRLMRIHLERMGLKVYEASNGHEALTCFKEQDIDLILMDIQMPVMDGLEASRAIRDYEEEQNTERAVPIIALSAAVFEHEKQHSFEAGMNDFIAKPVRKDDLIQVLGKWLEGVDDESYGERSIVDSIVDYNYSFDFERTIDEFEKDIETVVMVLNYFAENLTKQLLALQVALENEDFECIASEGHAIRGGAANLTAFDIEQLGARLEQAANIENRKACDRLLREIGLQLERFKADVVIFTESYS